MAATRTPTALRAVALLLAAAHLGLVARLLGRDAFGDFAGAFALAGIVGAIAEFGLVTTGVTAAVAAGEAGRRRIGGDLLVASAVLTTGAVALAATAGSVLLGGGCRTALWLLLPWVAVRGLQPGFTALRRGLGQYRRAAEGEVIGWTVTCAATVFLVLGPAEGHRTVGVALALVLGALVQVLVVACRVEPSRRGWMGCLAAAVPLGLTNAASALHVRLDQVVLAGFGLTGALAAYAIAYRVLDAVLALVTVLAGVSFAVMMRAPERYRPSVSQALGDRLVLIAAGVATTSYVLAPVLVRVLGGSAYADGALLLRLLCPALVASVLNAGAAQAVIAGRRQRVLLPIALTGLVLNLGINLVLVRRTGAVGAAAATSVTEVMGYLLVARTAAGALPGWSRPGTWLLPFLMVAGAAAVMAVVDGGSPWWLASLPILALPALIVLLRARGPVPTKPRLHRAAA